MSMVCDVKIENGSWWYFGEGAEGLKWYHMGPQDEKCVNWFGHEEDVTVAEAIERDWLDVNELTGAPRLRAEFCGTLSHLLPDTGSSRSG